MTMIHIRRRDFNGSSPAINGKSIPIPVNRDFDASDELIEVIGRAGIPYSLVQTLGDLDGTVTLSADNGPVVQLAVDGVLKRLPTGVRLTLSDEQIAVLERAGVLLRKNRVVTGGTPTPTPTAPVFTVQPSISHDGTPQVGEVLTGNDGTSNGTITARQWRFQPSGIAGTINIPGATGTTHTPADEGTYLYRVTSSNQAGDTSASSVGVVVGPSTVPVPVAQAAPTITGVAAQGQTLTGTAPAFTGSPTAYEYQWTSDDSVLVDRTATTLYAGDETVAKATRFGVRAQNAGGWSAWVYSDPVTVAASFGAIKGAAIYRDASFAGTTAPTTGQAFNPSFYGGVGAQANVASMTNSQISAGGGRGRLYPRLNGSGFTATYGESLGDQVVAAKMTRRGAWNDAIVLGIIARQGAGGAFTGYHLYYQNNGTPGWTLTAGSATALAGTTRQNDPWPAGENRYLLLSAIGTVITAEIYGNDCSTLIGRIVLPDSGSVATGSGPAGVRHFSGSTAAGDPDNGFAFEWIVQHVPGQAATYAAVLDAAIEGPSGVGSGTVRAWMFGAPPATGTITAQASVPGAVVPTGALSFAAIAGSQIPTVRVATYSLTPAQAATGSLGLASRQISSLPGLSYSAYSNAAVAFRDMSAGVRRGAATRPNAGAVNLNALLLSGGYVANWTTTLLSGAAGKFDLSSKKRFPALLVGQTLTANETFTFRFTSDLDGTKTIDVSVSVPAGVATISRQSDLDQLISAGAINGTTIEVATGAGLDASSGFTIANVNSSGSLGTVALFKPESATAGDRVGPFTVRNSQRITIDGMRIATSKSLPTPGVYGLGGTTNLVVNGCDIDGGAGGPDNTDARNWQTGIRAQGGSVTATNNKIRRCMQGITTDSTTSLIVTGNDIRYFMSNALIIGESRNLTRIRDNICMSPMRDRSNAPHPGQDHLDFLQFGDSGYVPDGSGGSKKGPGLEMENVDIANNIFLQADGNATVAGFFSLSNVPLGGTVKNTIIVFVGNGGSPAAQNVAKYQVGLQWTGGIYATQRRSYMPAFGSDPTYKDDQFEPYAGVQDGLYWALRDYNVGSNPGTLPGPSYDNVLGAGTTVSDMYAEGGYLIQFTSISEGSQTQRLFQGRSQVAGSAYQTISMDNMFANPGLLESFDYTTQDTAAIKAMLFAAFRPKAGAPVWNNPVNDAGTGWRA